MKNEVISVGPDPPGLVLSEGETPEISLSFRVCVSLQLYPPLPGEDIRRWWATVSQREGLCQMNTAMLPHQSRTPSLRSCESRHLCFGHPVCGTLLWQPELTAGLPWWLSNKESAWPCRRCGYNLWSGKVPWIPWMRKWQRTPVFLAGESHGQRSLEGYSPWGAKKMNMTERQNKSRAL